MNFGLTNNFYLDYMFLVIETESLITCDHNIMLRAPLSEY